MPAWTRWSNNCSAGVSLEVVDGGGDDHGNSESTATYVGRNSSTPGDLETGGDKDFFRFELDGSGTVEIASTGSTDTVGVLTSTDGRVHEENDDGGAARNFRIVVDDAQAGVHHVEVRGANSSTTGTYMLQVSFTPDAPDLVLDSPGLDRASVTPRGSFVLSVRVQNQGDAVSADTTLRYLRSPNPTISVSDTEVGTDPVGSLLPGLAGAESIALSAPAVSATYYYGACVNAVSGESDTSNNCSRGVALKVDDGGTDDHGDSESTATRVGPNSSTPGRLETAADQDFFRLELDESGVLEVASTGATDTVGVLTAADGRVLGENDDETNTSQNFRIVVNDAQPGVHYVEVKGFDSATGAYELQVSFTPAAAADPDLTVDSPRVDHARVAPGNSFVLSVRVRNHGPGASGRATLRYYRSQNQAITNGDTEVGSDPVGGLSAQADSTESISLTAPTVPAVYYYGGCVDAVPDESNRSNNCSGAVTVQVDTGLVVDDHGDTQSTATLIRPNSSTMGRLEKVGDKDFFRLELAVSGALEVVSTGGIDTHGTLTTADGRVLEDDDSGANKNFRIATDTPAGVHYIEVRAFNRLVRGAYELLVSFSPDGPGVTRSLRLGDLDGDRYDDVLLRHTANGRWLYYANGGHGRPARSVPATPNLAWGLAGAADVNGDGHDDLLLRHADLGRWLYYDLSGASPRTVWLNLTPRAVWHFAGLGDLDGDGDDDVLLRHNGGLWLYYAMDGDRGFPVRNLGLTTNLAWALAGVGDLNADGYGDVLLRHADRGQWLYYDLSGARPRKVWLNLTPSPDWRFAALGDLDGDGDDDVLLRHAENGNWRYYAMDGERGRLVSITGATTNAVWTLSGVGDVNGDGRDDLLLRHADRGQWLYYDLIDGGAQKVWLPELTSNQDWAPPTIAPE